jgi:hypothetical protein
MIRSIANPMQRFHCGLAKFRNSSIVLARCNARRRDSRADTVGRVGVKSFHRGRHGYRTDKLERFARAALISTQTPAPKAVTAKSRRAIQCIS